jgi:hypothetical protein
MTISMIISISIAMRMAISKTINYKLQTINV